MPRLVRAQVAGVCDLPPPTKSVRPLGVLQVDTASGAEARLRGAAATAMVTLADDSAAFHAAEAAAKAAGVPLVALAKGRGGGEWKMPPPPAKWSAASLRTERTPCDLDTCVLVLHVGSPPLP